jgi:hypothetical protein
VQIKRRGGLAGVTLHADVDTAELGEPTAAKVDDALARLPTGTGSTAGAHPDAPRHPDAFRYEITIPGRAEPVSVHEHDLPSELEPLIKLVPKVGRVEHAPERKT